MHKWIEKAMGGDVTAFEQLVCQTLPEVYFAVSKRVQTEELTFDLTRECYVSAWHSISLFQMDEEPLEWILRIADNICNRHLNRHPRDAATGAMGECKPPKTLLASIMSAIEAERPQKQWKTMLKRFRFTLVAVLIAILILFFGSRMEQRRLEPEQIPENAYAIVRPELVPAALEPVD